VGYACEDKPTISPPDYVWGSKAGTSFEQEEGSIWTRLSKCSHLPRPVGRRDDGQKTQTQKLWATDTYYGKENNEGFEVLIAARGLYSLIWGKLKASNKGTGV